MDNDNDRAAKCCFISSFDLKSGDLVRVESIDKVGRRLAARRKSYFSTEAQLPCPNYILLEKTTVMMFLGLEEIEIPFGSSLRFRKCCKFLIDDQIWYTCIPLYYGKNISVELIH
jgi:hypothetical protein